MEIIIDTRSPVPKYHQIAEVIRYRIATGKIRPGDSLPPLRVAAKKWGVNINTVRRAFSELASEGLVDPKEGRGTRVLGRGRVQKHNSSTNKLDRFVEHVLREAREKHKLTPGALTRLLANWTHESHASANLAYVVECSESECEDHVNEIETIWDVRAKPWCLSLEGEPPPGPLVATYFHLNEIRRKWPHRLHEIHFAAIGPDPQLISRIQLRAGKGKRVTLTLCEFEEPMALNICADLSNLFPADKYSIKPRIVRNANELLTSSRSGLFLLFSPRVWDQLKIEGKKDPRVFKVTYVFIKNELETMGEFFGWRRRHRSIGR